NTVRLIGFDQFGKKIILDDVQFVVGSGTISINLSNNLNIVDDSISLKVIYKNEKREYLGLIEHDDGVLYLLNVPISSEERPDEKFEVFLEGIGEKIFFSETFLSLSSIEDNVEVSLYPDFVNNDLSLNNDLSSWEVSPPERVKT